MDRFIKKILTVFTLSTIMCVQVDATQLQGRKTVDDFLEYSNKLTNYNDTTIIKNICYMSNYRLQHGKDSINLLLEKRSVILNSQINDTIADILQSILLYYDSLNNKDITFFINSPGGSVYAGLGIYDTMQFISSDVATICTGMAASMAAVLLVAGKKGKRFALKHSRIMIHQPTGGAQGQASDIEITAREILKLKKELYSIISEHSGTDLEKVERDCDRDYWMTSQEAMDYGMIDKVLFGAKESQEYGIIDYVIE